MDPEHYRAAYEQIDNQILRILLYFGGACILTLSSALAYLWATWRNDQRARIDVDIVNANALNSVANELDNLRERLAEMDRTIAEKLTTNHADHERKSSPRA